MADMDNRKDILASIIVPVYDVEKYLPACIESILRQTWKNIQVILIDDGSPDWCGQICDQYARKDPRIEVIHQKNQGLSCARNAGLAAARGEVLFFVDSDDTVEPDFCEKPLRAMKRYGTDIVCFGTRVHNEVGKTSKYLRTRREEILSSEEAIRRMLCVEMLNDVWSMAASSFLYEGLQFPAGYLSENTLISAQLMHRANRIVAIPNVLYNHLSPRKGSICYVGRLEMLSGKLARDGNILAKQRHCYLKKHYPKLLPLEYRALYRGYISRYFLTIIYSHLYEESGIHTSKANCSKGKKADAYIRQNIIKIITSSCLPVRYRVWAVVYYVMPDVAIKIYLLLKRNRDR